MPSGDSSIIGPLSLFLFAPLFYLSWKQMEEGLIRNRLIASILVVSLSFNAVIVTFFWELVDGRHVLLNSVSLILWTVVFLKAFSQAYSKYFFVLGLFFLTWSSIPFFIFVFILSLLFFISLKACFFYGKTIFYGNFWKKTFFLGNQGSDRMKTFLTTDAVIDAFLFFCTFFPFFFLLKFIQNESRIFSFVSYSGISPFEKSFIAFVISASIAYAIFRLRGSAVSFLSGRKNLFKFLVIGICFAVVWWAMFLNGGHSGQIVQIAAFMVLFFLIRIVFSFYATCDGKELVHFLTVRPGQSMDKEFLKTVIHDYQYELDKGNRLIENLWNRLSRNDCANVKLFLISAILHTPVRAHKSFNQRTFLVVNSRTSLFLPFFVSFTGTCFFNFPGFDSYF